MPGPDLGGGLPLVGGLQTLGGIVQGIGGYIQNRRATKALEALQTPQTTSSAAVSDYYNKAMQSPYDTSMYQMQRQNAMRGTAAGLSALQDRRAGLQGVSGLVRAQDDALLRAGATAEQQQKSMLGNAVRLKASDDQRVFQQNKMLPFQQRFGLLSAKAAGGSQIMNSGLQNIFGGMSAFGMGMGSGQSQGYTGNTSNYNP